jgi:hypothetical protein
MKKKINLVCRTGNPFEVKIVWVERTNDMRQIRAHIHDQIKDNNVRGEWYDIPRVLALELRKQVKHDS